MAAVSETGGDRKSELCVATTRLLGWARHDGAHELMRRDEQRPSAGVAEWRLGATASGIRRLRTSDGRHELSILIGAIG